MENFDISDKSYFINNFTNFFNTNDANTKISYQASEKNKEKYKYVISLGESTKVVTKSFQNF
jgi:hypothetical protein